MSKVCTKCGKEYLATKEFFYKDRQKKDNLRPDCKLCANKVAYIYNNTEVGRLVHNKANARYKKTTKGKFTNWKAWLKRKYGITPADYNVLSEHQEHLCAICKKPETMTYNKKIKILCVDHDHKTGKVRGLLCSRCNRAIGLLEDNELLLINAIEYLEEN